MPVMWQVQVTQFRYIAVCLPFLSHLCLISTMALTDFSCVHFEDGDTIGKVLAYIALLPYVIIIHHASTLYSRREAHQMFLLFGFFANEALARGLKYAMRHPRPIAHCQRLDLCDSHGMPSSHTQCAFFALGLHIFMAARHWEQKSAGARICAALESLALSCIAPLVAVSRVYLHYHYVDQVVVGAVLGLLFASIWCAMLCSRAVARVRSKLLQVFVAFGMKDTWAVGDALLLEQGMHAKAKAKQL